MYQQTIQKIAFSKIPRLGPKYGRLLLEKVGLAAFFEMEAVDFEKIEGLTPLIIEQITSNRDVMLEQAAQEYEQVDKHGIKVLFYQDENYPLNLRPFETAPLLLYQKGDVNLSFPRTVGIIGTRKPTPEGVLFTEQLVQDLKSFDIQTVSGLAYGIDAACHKQSVKENIPTIGVLGNGFHRVYPTAHQKLAFDMLEQGGALLTEFSFFDPPLPEHFPSRNRIVAALSDALIVVESATKGGSMITAKFANQYNKDVFALPGRHNDAKSAGCNLLIKSHQANLFTSAADIGYIMRWKGRNMEARQLDLFEALLDQEKRLVDCLRESRNLTIDQLAYRLGENTGTVATLALQLEFKGLLKSIPGNRYMLC